jgi:chemotaxis protein CheD
MSVKWLAAREAIEIFLQIGDFHFADRKTRIRTTLGSCVSITMWHPGLREGGMCHYMLPCNAAPSGARLDGRYADDAIELFVAALRRNGTRPGAYEVKLFGGGRMYGDRGGAAATEPVQIGPRNIEAARRLLRGHGFRISREHLAGEGHRNVIFDIASGETWVRHVANLLPAGDCRGGWGSA